MTTDELRQPYPTASFVVVANRLPVERVAGPDGGHAWRASPGGLVAALEPVMRDRAGVWVGWHGVPDADVEPFQAAGIDLVPVSLSSGEVGEYYEGMANATLWPLYHDAVAFPEFHREWWDAYVRVNRRFAEAAASVVERGGTVWVHDYHLQLVPEMLRALRPDVRIGFFLHIPFPPWELFRQLPWRKEILQGIAGADLVGFQVDTAVANFLRLTRRVLRYSARRGAFTTPDGRTGRAGTYPIAVDARGLAALADSPQVVAAAQRVREELGARTLVLGVDRLDYTKGLRQRVRAFGELFAEGRLDPDEVVFLQVASPSRERVPEYGRLRDDIDRLVGRINGTLGRVGRTPITYLRSTHRREELAALYRAADVMVVTPLSDGMNLVAKEYVACRTSGTGALVLSEFAGAATALQRAYLVNPYDINGMKETILSALSDSTAEKRARMRAMRRQVFTHDVARWARTFLEDLAEPRDLAPQGDLAPQVDPGPQK